MLTESQKQKYERQRKWTKETVIKAIQDWAAEHGRPPTSPEWHNASPDGKYPCFRSVYGPEAEGRPFPKWADAIEAAGFPRPRQRAGKNYSENRAKLGWPPLRYDIKPERKWKKR